MKRGAIFTKEQAFEMTNGGRAIFEDILGDIPTRNINSPLRNDDENASFEIKVKNGIYYFKDYGGMGESGNAIDFLMLINGWNFGEALKNIQKDYYGKEISHIKIANKDPTFIEYQTTQFDYKHKFYFDKYGLPEHFLNANGVYAIERFSINKKVFIIPSDVASFVYIHESGKVKILQIGENVERKWINNVPNNALWFLPKEKCEQLWVIKSVKDALCLKYYFGFCVTAVQNESGAILDSNMPKILEVSQDIVLNFGSDPQGVRECITVQQKYSTKYWNTPKYLLKYNVEDVSDLIAEFGVENVRKELKKKKFI